MQGQTEPIRQLVELWRTTGGVAKAAIVVAAVTLAGLLVMWYAHDAPVQAPPDSAARFQDASEREPPRKWAIPVAMPLQQGLERLAAELEDILSQMDGISKAEVVLNRLDPTLFGDEEAHVTAAMCLWFAPDTTPSAATLQGIAAYVSRAVPDLTEQGVTIVDGKGRTLFLDGQVVQSNLQDLAAAASTKLTVSKRPSPRWSWRPGSVSGTIALGLAVVVVLTVTVMMLRRGGRLSLIAAGADNREFQSEPPTAEEASPLSGLEAGAIAAALRLERPQVIAFALTRMGPDEAAVVLEGMPAAVRRDMQERMARLKHVSPVIASAAEKAIAESARLLGASSEEVNQWGAF